MPTPPPADLTPAGYPANEAVLGTPIRRADAYGGVTVLGVYFRAFGLFTFRSEWDTPTGMVVVMPFPGDFPTVTEQMRAKLETDVNNDPNAKGKARDLIFANQAAGPAPAGGAPDLTPMHSVIQGDGFGALKVRLWVPASAASQTFQVRGPSETQTVTVAASAVPTAVEVEVRSEQLYPATPDAPGAAIAPQLVELIRPGVGVIHSTLAPMYHYPGVEPKP